MTTYSLIIIAQQFLTSMLLAIVSISFYMTRKEVKLLKELRELDNEIIEDLQKRLKDNGLDCSIG